MLFDRIKRVLSLIKDMKAKANETFNKYSDYFEPGVWKCSYNLLYLYKKGQKARQESEGTFVWRGIKRTAPELNRGEKLSRWFFSKTYRVRKKKSAPTVVPGRVLALTSQGITVKIFNAEMRAMWTVYPDTDAMNDYLKKRETWASLGGGCFRVIPILEVNTEKLFIKEEFFEKEKFSPEDAFKQVLSDYLKCSRVIGKDSKSEVISDDEAKTILKTAEKLHIPEVGEKAVDFMRSENYRLNICHGDVNPTNLILSNGKYYYIDFEAVGKRWFFYDIAYYMVKAYRQVASDLPQRFLNGEFDETFEELFRLNGAKYDPSNRSLYLFVFEMIFSSFGKYPFHIIKYPEIFGI